MNNSEERTSERTAVTVLGRGGVALGDLSSPEAFNAALQHVQNALRFKEKALELLVKTCRKTSIRDMDGRPYFLESECERILSILGGAAVERLSVTRDPEDQYGHYGVEMVVRVSHSTFGSEDGIGYASTREKFIGAGGKRDLDDVVEHNVRQLAYTRAKGSAIRNLLSLKNFEWADLEAMGFKRGAGGTTNFKKGPRSQEREPEPPPAQEGFDEAKATQRAIVASSRAAGISSEDVLALAKDLGYEGALADCHDRAVLDKLLEFCREQERKVGKPEAQA